MVPVSSGSPGIVVDTLFGRDFFKYVLINEIEFSDDGKIAGGRATPFDFKGKADGLVSLAKKEGIDLSSTVFVGDNSNDVWIAKAAGLAIGVNCKSEALREVCDHVLPGKDLRALLPLIG